MDTEQILYTDGEIPDITTQLPNITSAITDMLAPFILLSLVISFIFLAFFVMSMIRRRKLEKALFDIQKNLSEMNERDKARDVKTMPSTQLKTRNETIATAEHESDTTNTTT